MKPVVKAHDGKSLSFCPPLELFLKNTLPELQMCHTQFHGIMEYLNIPLVRVCNQTKSYILNDFCTIVNMYLALRGGVVSIELDIHKVCHHIDIQGIQYVNIVRDIVAPRRAILRFEKGFLGMWECSPNLINYNVLKLRIDFKTFIRMDKARKTKQDDHEYTFNQQSYSHGFLLIIKQYQSHAREDQKENNRGRRGSGQVICDDLTLDRGQVNQHRPIVMPNVSGDIFLKIVEYCKHVKTQSPSGENDVELMAIVSELVNNDEKNLFGLLFAADYLAIKGLLSLACEEVLYLIKHKNLVHICKLFNIMPEFFPEDEESMRSTNPWAFN
ncbi:hypothetical protein M9H77_30032 [Catharanthus roseus]|uniref:Uncharacterized protein n=1 Tax=Catharanthus roseus TaxID=4058 RepID=A0ACB9ZX53_CATRO|nr:hypothetical protein M9H77_30032 [Catharanthus roseus]